MSSGEITRQRGRTQAPGMSGPLGIQDAAAQRTTSELQAMMEDLYGRLNALKATGSEDTAAFDDTALQRLIRDLRRDVDDLERRVSALERKFPIVRYARVKGVQNDYLECVFYSPGADLEGGAINVAKPFNLRVTPFAGATLSYFDGSTVTYTYASAWEREADDGETSTQTLTPYYLNEIIAVADTGPAFYDGDGAIVRYEDLNLAGRDWGGGGGSGNIRIYYGADEAAIRALSPTETFAFGFALAESMLLGWENGTWRRLNYLKVL